MTELIAKTRQKEREVKNIWVVNEPNGETRRSKQMTFSSATLAIFTLITLIAKFYEFEVAEYQAMALAGGVVGMAGAVSGIVLRWRSKGGVIKAKEDGDTL